MKEKPDFLHYLHSFRGFAIFCIVAVHAGVSPILALGGFQDVDESNFIFIISEVIFHDSTIYFAMISGLLYAVVLQKRGLGRFVRSKFLYIFLPYLFFSALLSIGRPPSGPGEPPGLHHNFLSYLTTLGKNLLYGKAIPIYWYLPVLFVLYIFTPVISRILQAKGALKWLIFPIILAPLVVSRHPLEMGYIFHWEDSVYFLGAYAIGMWMGYHLDVVIEWIRIRWIWMMVMVLVTFGVLGYLYVDKITNVGITSLQESVHYINKLLIAGLVMIYFKQRTKQPKVMTALANDSFAIYFIHFIFIFATTAPLVPFIQNEGLYPFNVIISIPFILVLTLLLSKGLIWLLKKLLGSTPAW